jgi:uncharacterized membrane protein
VKLHPVHPALAHFPIAFWVGASLADLIALWTRVPVWWTVSHHAIAAGVIAGSLAVLAGFTELALRKLPPPAVAWAIGHASLMGTALLVFMVSLAWRNSVPPPIAAVALGFLGSAIVLAGGFCGGTLVYRFGVGVAWQPGASD